MRDFYWGGAFIKSSQALGGVYSSRGVNSNGGVYTKKYNTSSLLLNIGSSAGHEHAKELVDSIKAKKETQEILASINNIPSSVPEDVEMDDVQGKQHISDITRQT